MIRVAVIMCALLAFAGCQSESSKPLEREVKPMIARFFLENGPGEAGTTLQLPVSRVAIDVNSKPVLTEYDIAGVNLARVDVGWCLAFQLTPAARRDFYRMTSTVRGRRIVVTLNGLPAGALRLDQVVSDGVLPMFVEVSDAELPEFADRIRKTSEMLAQHVK
jgi:hypothetical protein